MCFILLWVNSFNYNAKIKAEMHRKILELLNKAQEQTEKMHFFPRLYEMDKSMDTAGRAEYHLIFQTCGRRHPPIYSWTAKAHCPNIHQNGSQSSSNPKHHLDPNISAGACKMVASVMPWHFTVESVCLQALSPAVMEMITDRFWDSQQVCILMKSSTCSACKFVC